MSVKASGAVETGCPNWANRTIFVGDNLDVLRGMNSASIDLVYLDPPFNSNRTYSAPVGSVAAGASFKDAWTLSDLDEAWLGIIAEKYPAMYSICQTAELSHSKGMKSYLAFMAVRIMELYRILKATGSLYLHVDPTASHYLKLILDAVFGKDNFRNEVVWCYTGPGSPKMRQFNRKHDTILWYSKGEYWTFNRDAVRLPYKSGAEKKFRKTDANIWGAVSDDQAKAIVDRGKIPETWWTGIHSSWYMSKYEKTGYPTQKPLKLLERIVKASSNEGDMVLDPFCGCATTCDASERLGRQWVGIDISLKAYDLIRMRLERASDDGALFKGGKNPDVIVRSDIPMRTDVGEPIEYSTVKHKLFGVQAGRCNGCRHEFHFRHFEVDHIIARVVGGTDHEDNLQLLCGSCNRIKGKKSQAELMARLKEMKLVA